MELGRPVLQSENGPAQDVLTCAVCFDIAWDPVVTPCGHVFCRPCILHSLGLKSQCPYDERALRKNDLKELEVAMRRIWLRLLVCCSQCQWKGTMDAYSKHRPNCIAELRDFERRIEELKSQHAAEKAQLLAAHAQELLSRKRNSWMTNMKTIFRYIDDGLCHVVGPALRCIVDFRLFCSFEPLVIAGSLHADYIDGSYLVQGAS
jgi:Zinc finger, C3HC4 type (RING finger)